MANPLEPWQIIPNMQDRYDRACDWGMVAFGMVVWTLLILWIVFFS